MTDDSAPPGDKEGAPSTRSTLRWTAIVVGVAVVILGGATAAIAAHVRGGHHQEVLVAKSSTRPLRHPLPLRLTAISPTTHAAGVGFDAPITLTFSDPLVATIPKLRIVPAIAGRWTHPTPNKLEFTPSANLVPLTVVHVFVPGGPSGVRARNGTHLSATIETGFTIEEASVARLQQLLAELDYLPVAFAPSGNGVALSRASSTLDAEPTEPAAVSLEPVAGSFVWRFANVPSQLRAAWTPDEWNVATEGAVIAFQSDHDLAVNGEPTNATWAALLKAVAQRKVTTRPYDYLLVTETLPETLYVWQEGKVIYQSPANTGVPGATTALGTFPVYLRYTVTTMSGTNPDGSHYVDTGIPWVSYFNGSDAVHGFVRSGYGYPQSDGCVELPIANAAKVYPLDPYGTLVTVTTGDLTNELGTPAPTEIAPPPAPTTTAKPTTTKTSTTTTTTAPAPPKKPRPKPIATTTTTTTTSTTTTTTTTTIPTSSSASATESP